LADCALNINKEYRSVTKISKDITCTSARTDPIIAYLDWLKSPIIKKKILLKSTKTKWYRIKESTFSNKKREGPQIKFCEKTNWVAYKRARKIGANAVLGLGIRKISFVRSLIKSSAI
jgi:hypothetical protein